MYRAPIAQLTQTQLISTTSAGVDVFEVRVSGNLDKAVSGLGATALSKVADWSAHVKYTRCAVFLQFVSGMVVLQPAFVDSQRIYIPVLVERDGLM